MEYDRQFLTGVVGVLLLGLLSERAMYGYEILQEDGRENTTV
jgi:DNA-binding PadR family transcriptional regulator